MKGHQTPEEIDRAKDIMMTKMRSNQSLIITIRQEMAELHAGDRSDKKGTSGKGKYRKLELLPDVEEERKTNVKKP